MVYDIPLDVANLLGFALATFLYGGYCIVFAITIRCLALRTRRGRSKVVFSTMLGLFLATTTTIVLCAIDNYVGWIKRRDDPNGGTIAYFADSRNALRITRDFLLLCAALMADGLICWRLFVIWAHNYWVLILPIFLLVSEAVIGTLLVALEYYQIAHPADTRFRGFFIFGPIFVCVCSAAVNILVTSLIAGRLWLIQRRVEGLADKDVYNRIIRVLIESGAIYTATIFVFFVFVVAGLPGAYRFADYLVTVAVAIAPTLIVLQLNSSRKDDSMGGAQDLHSTSIEFQSPSYFDDERSSYRVSSVFDVNFTDLPSSSPATSRFRERERLRRVSLRSPPSRRSLARGGSTPTLTAATSTSTPRIHLDRPSNSSLRTNATNFLLLASSKSSGRSRSDSFPMTPLSIPRAVHVPGGGSSDVSLSPTTVELYAAEHGHWTLGLEGGELDGRVSTVEEGSGEGSGENGTVRGSTVLGVLGNQQEEEMLPPLPTPLSPHPSMNLARPSLSSLRDVPAVPMGHARTRTLSSPQDFASRTRTLSSPLQQDPRPFSPAGRPGVVSPSTARPTVTSPSTTRPNVVIPPTARPTVVSPSTARPVVSPPSTARPSTSSSTGRPSLSRPSVEFRQPATTNLNRPSNSSLREVVSTSTPLPSRGASSAPVRPRPSNSSLRDTPVRPPRPSNSSGSLRDAATIRPRVASQTHAQRPSMSRPSNSSLREAVSSPLARESPTVAAPPPPPPGRRRQQRRSDLPDPAKGRAWK